jgi:hypothetical protein
MRRLFFALAAVSAVAFAGPASAQTFYAGADWGPYGGVGLGPAYNYYDYGYRPWAAGWGGPSYYGYGYAPAAVGVYAAPPVASTTVVIRERPVARRIVRERRVVRYRDDAFGAYAYSPGYGSYGSPYVSVGVAPRRYGWFYD